MIRDQDRYKTFTRRAVLLASGKLALFSVLAGRMYYLQVVDSERYHTLAEDNRINLRLLAPPRGRILDRNGIEIAANQQNYRLIIVTERSPDVEGTLDRLGRIIELGEHDRRRVLREVRRKRGFVPVTIRENLDWEEVARVEINAPDLPGIHIEVGQTRFYPYDEAAAHLIGYVGAVSADEQTGDPLLDLPSFRIGKNGIEKTAEERLRGRAGRSEVEVNALGRVIRELSRREGQPGDEIRLTVDMALQNFAYKRLEGESGAAVVMDVHSGEVLTLVSVPGFDPNAFNKGISRDYWQELIGNERAPLTNKAIAGQYAPGSTFKMIVAMAALEADIITPDHRTFCAGHVELGNVRFHCWKKHGHGHLDLEGALQQSCDIYFYDIARRVGVDRISAMARKFGLGKALGIELPGEKPGVVPTRDWKLAILGTPWQLGETLVTGIGQGFVLATPLQLAVMTARIANGGRAVVPTLSRDGAAALAAGEDGGTAAPPAAFPGLDLSSGAIEAVSRGMYAVSNTPHGTAFRSRIREDGMEIAGKTGTSQVRRITLAERQQGVRKNEDLPWRERDHAMFVAYAPAHAPKYAIAVVVEHGGSGSAAAAPVARDIMVEVLKRDPAADPLLPLREARAASSAPVPARRATEMLSGFYRQPEMTLGEKLAEVNWGLVLILTMIAAIGFIMLYSAGNGSLQPWAARQMVRFGIGLCLLVGLALVDLKFWLRYAYAIYFTAFALLVAVEIMGDIGMGAQRWLSLGVFNLQPSEVMKVALIIVLARYFHTLPEEAEGKLRYLLWPTLLVLAPVALVLRQPDLGTAMMLLMVGGALFFMAGVRLWKFAVAFGAVLAAVPVIWQFLKPYQQNRVLTFLNPESDPLGAGYHILQSKIALGSGGIFGKGFLQGSQAHLNFLPEKQTDFIFTMLAEEFGLTGGLALLGLYGLVLVYGFSIALHAQSQFGRLLAVGVTATFFLYVFINIAMVMGLVPVVGVPLPLISYGGTSMLTLLIGFGILIGVNVHRDMVIGRSPRSEPL